MDTSTAPLWWAFGMAAGASVMSIRHGSWGLKGAGLPGVPCTLEWPEAMCFRYREAYIMWSNSTTIAQTGCIIIWSYNHTESVDRMITWLYDHIAYFVSCSNDHPAIWAYDRMINIRVVLRIFIHDHMIMHSIQGRLDRILKYFGSLEQILGVVVSQEPNFEVAIFAQTAFWSL